MKPNIVRYNKQILLNEIGESGQERICNSKVLVIGAGGIGCPVLSYLVSAGVGTVGILDFDKVEISNLHRQVLYDESQIGIFKAEAAADKLRKLNSEVSLSIHKCFLSSKNGFEIFKGYEIIIDATDNFRSRYLINDICVNLNKPFVMGSINKFEAQAAVLNYNNGPTYRCIYPESPDESTVASCEQSGVIGSLCGIIGTIMATETLKIITGAGNLLSGEIIFVNSLKMEFHKLKVRRNTDSVAKAYRISDKVSL